MCGCRWKLQDNGEEGVLEKDGLPKLSTLLHLEWIGVGHNDRWIAVEAQSVCLADQDASKTVCSDFPSQYYSIEK